MQLKHLALAQVRAFEQAEFDFQPDMNLLVGVNGAGKSTVLDVLRTLLSQILPQFINPRMQRQEFTGSDIRIGRGAMTTEMEFALDDKEYCYLVHIPRNEYQADPEKEGNVREQAYDLHSRFELTPEVIRPKSISAGQIEHPLAVYFSTSRSVPTMAAPRAAGSGPAAANADALISRQLRLRDLAEWWLVQDALAEETQSRLYGRHLAVLSDTVSRFLDNCTNLRAVRDPEVTLLIDKQDGPLDVRQLSDGERSMIALVLDLAKRLAQANPHLDDPIAQGQAVVLIDELDLHLHPGWQRSVVEKLTRTFPKCQFIATTHSPQIVGEVSPDNIMLIGNGQVIRPDQSLGMDSNWILRYLMGVPDRNEPTQAMLYSIEQLIEDEEYDAASDKIVQLREGLGEFPALAGLQARIDMIRFLSENEENEEVQ